MHIDGTYIKYYSKPENKHLLFLIPGQSLTPRAFWDFKLPDGKTHSEHFLNDGLDVILFDPKGYGNSTEFANYDRVEYANQINKATQVIEKEYVNKAILGFSTSTAPAIIAADYGYFNKVIIHSAAVFQNPTGEYSKEEKWVTNMDLLKAERIAKVSDRIIPKSNKIDGWDKAVVDVLGSDSWTAPMQVIEDIRHYWTFHRNHGFKNMDTEILNIYGEYDFEHTNQGYIIFKTLFKNVTDVVIPNSTHFSMWENNSHLTRNAIIEYVKL